MNDYLILTFIGGFTGILAGFVGGGSDVLIVPMLLFFHVFSNIKTEQDLAEVSSACPQTFEIFIFASIFRTRDQMEAK